MKYQDRKKKLVKTASIAGGITFTLLIIIAFMVNTISNLENEKVSRKSNLASLNQQVQKTRDETEKAKKYLELYNNLAAKNLRRDFVNPQRVSEILDSMKKSHLIGELTAEIGQIEETKAAGFKNNNAATYFTNVTLRMKSVTDENIFAFISELPSKIGGEIRVKNMEIKKLKEFDNNDIMNLRQGNLPLIVEANLTFNWISMAPIDNGSGNNNQTPANGGQR